MLIESYGISNRLRSQNINGLLRIVVSDIKNEFEDYKSLYKNCDLDKFISYYNKSRAYNSVCTYNISDTNDYNGDVEVYVQISDGSNMSSYGDASKSFFYKRIHLYIEVQMESNGHYIECINLNHIKDSIIHEMTHCVQNYHVEGHALKPVNNARSNRMSVALRNINYIKPLKQPKEKEKILYNFLVSHLPYILYVLSDEERNAYVAGSLYDNGVFFKFSSFMEEFENIIKMFHKYENVHDEDACESIYQSAKHVIESNEIDPLNNGIDFSMKDIRNKSDRKTEQRKRIRGFYRLPSTFRRCMSMIRDEYGKLKKKIQRVNNHYGELMDIDLRHYDPSKDFGVDKIYMMFSNSVHFDNASYTEQLQLISHYCHDMSEDFYNLAGYAGSVFNQLSDTDVNKDFIKKMSQYGLEEDDYSDYCEFNFNVFGYFYAFLSKVSSSAFFKYINNPQRQKQCIDMLKRCITYCENSLVPTEYTINLLNDIFHEFCDKDSKSDLYDYDHAVDNVYLPNRSNFITYITDISAIIKYLYKKVFR